VNNWLDDRAQAQLLKEAEVESQKPLDLTRVASGSAAPDYRKISNLLDEGDDEAEQTTPLDANSLKDGQLLGIIRYAKLDIELPIVEGATKQNMKSAAVHVTGTQLAGMQDGNMAVAAHRAHKTGRLFNRLGEAKVGDVIEIEQGGKTYAYEVDNIHVVEPTQVEVLNPTRGETALTLITCDPIINPTHRLIVHAVLKT